MECNEVNGLLDLLMDGELDDEQRQAMEAHGRQCPECAAAIHSTLQMKALFEQLEPEADVPLEAQARWRGAVREEANARKQKRLRRWIASAAAAAVVLVGMGAAIRPRFAPKQEAMPRYVEQSEVASLEELAPEPALVSNAVSGLRAGAVVEADGAVAAGEADMDLAVPEAAFESEATASGQWAPACEMTLQVADVETACKRVSDLAQEYEAVADVQAAGDGGANVYVEIAADNAGDFLNAVASMDASGRAVKAPELTGSGQVLVLLALHQ